MTNKEKYGNCIKCEYKYSIDYFRNRVEFNFTIRHELSWNTLYQKHYFLDFEKAKAADLISETLLNEWLEAEVQENE